MKTNDLRIENYVSFHDVWYKIADIEKDRVIIEYHNGETDYYPIEYIDPIELTEEVLLKFGFILTDKDYSCFEIWHNNTFIRYVQKFNLLYLENLVSEEEGLHSEIKLYGVKYLHELQNAYYLLTNEELEVKI